jgi:hypothetical protein
MKRGGRSRGKYYLLSKRLKNRHPRAEFMRVFMIRKFSIALFAVLSGLGLCNTAAHASIVGLTNTGVNFNPGTLVDNAWSIVGGSNSLGSPYQGPAYTDANNGTFPIPPWVPNSSVSRWDTPTNPLSLGLDQSVDGTYVYRTTFTSIGTTGFFTGQFAADNAVTSITLNGGTTIYTGPGSGSQFDGWTSFAYTGSLINGLNTIDFSIVNYGLGSSNPSGLNVEFLTASVPEASTWCMLIIGFACIGFLSYRRKQAPSFRLA